MAVAAGLSPSSVPRICSARGLKPHLTKTFKLSNDRQFVEKVKEHWMRAGRACQRFALQVAALGLKVAFVNQPAEVASLRPESAAIVGLPWRRPDLVMRFGYGPTLPVSARRPVGAELVEGSP